MGYGCKSDGGYIDLGKNYSCDRIFALYIRKDGVSKVRSSFSRAGLIAIAAVVILLIFLIFGLFVGSAARPQVVPVPSETTGVIDSSSDSE